MNASVAPATEADVVDQLLLTGFQRRLTLTRYATPECSTCVHAQLCTTINLPGRGHTTHTRWVVAATGRSCNPLLVHDYDVLADGSTQRRPSPELVLRYASFTLTAEDAAKVAQWLGIDIAEVE